jgi:hypothetical protein
MGNGFWLYREVQSIIAIVCLSLRWHCATAYGSKEVILLSVFYGTAKARALIRIFAAPLALRDGLRQ